MNFIRINQLKSEDGSNYFEKKFVEYCISLFQKTTE